MPTATTTRVPAHTITAVRGASGPGYRVDAADGTALGYVTDEGTDRHGMATWYLFAATGIRLQHHHTTNGDLRHAAASVAVYHRENEGPVR